MLLLPRVLLIEITSRCNADCVICGRRWWKGSDLIGELPFETYCDVIDRLDCVESVKLGQYGEPLMYKKIVDAVAYAKVKGKFVWLTTNASLLTEDRAKALLDARLDKIIFSVDAIDEKTFERVRPPLRWQIVIDNIARFCDLREGYNIDAVVNAVITPEAHTTEGAFKAYWEGFGLGCSVVDEVDVSPPQCEYVNGDSIDCERPHEHITIRADGSVILCCRDCHAIEKFGNVHDVDPLVIFNSDRFNKIRTVMETGVGYPKMCVGCRLIHPNPREPRRP